MIEFAVKIDGRWRILDAGPGTMIAFEDEFGQSMPDGAEGAHLWRHLLWIAYRIESPEGESFATWVERVEDITGQDDRIDEIRAELGSDPPERPLEAVTGESG